MSYNIAIDGPAGAGKSTIAKKIAADRGFIYVDTGAMYRAMALFMLDKGIDPGDAEQVAEISADADISIKYENGIQCVYLNGRNVNDKLRTEAVSSAASKTSAVKQVRTKLVALQQKLARNSDVVMDGRDIGSKVLPDADLKIFLTASVDVRAKRRFDENTARGIICDPDEIRKEIAERDERDMTRAESPLIKAQGAVEVDTSDMTIDEVVKTIEEMIR